MAVMHKGKAGWLGYEESVPPAPLHILIVRQEGIIFRKQWVPDNLCFRPAANPVACGWSEIVATEDPSTPLRSGRDDTSVMGRTEVIEQGIFTAVRHGTGCTQNRARNFPQGLKPSSQLGLFGTTKVVPCYKTTTDMSFFRSL